MVIGRKLGDGFWKLVSFRIIQLHQTSALCHRVDFYMARKGPYIKSGDSMKQQTHHCSRRGGFIDGEEARKVTQTLWCHG